MSYKAVYGTELIRIGILEIVSVSRMKMLITMSMMIRVQKRT